MVLEAPESAAIIGREFTKRKMPVGYATFPPSAARCALVPGADSRERFQFERGAPILHESCICRRDMSNRHDRFCSLRS
jgi:hypothetical protein